MKDIILTLAVVAVVAIAVRGWLDRQDRIAWEARADAAVAAASQEAARADRAITRADSLEQEADRLERVADSLGQRTRERVVEVREVEVPGYAAPYVAPRDSIIDDLIVENDTLRRANDTLREEVGVLQVALGRVTASNASLREVLEDRPRPTPWWLPSTGLGVFAGACSDGRMCSGLGITVSWRIPLP